MILAASEGNLVFLVVMAVIGLINWLVSKLNEQKQKPKQPPPSRDVGPRSAPPDAEDERMRRFLEALGLPADSAQRPVPPIVEPSPVQRRPKASKKRQAVPPPPLPREMSLDEQPAPSRPVAQIELPELSVPTMSEFQTVSSHIGAIPSERPAMEKPMVPGSALSDLIRRDLSSPSQLRSAFLLREILGPPRGLQS